MIKKIIMGILLTTVFGAGSAAIVYQTTNQEMDAVAAESKLTEPQTDVNEQTGEQSIGGPVIAADGIQETAWQESGSIMELDDYGFKFSFGNDEVAYIELGPPEYWQNQGVDLQIGQQLDVEGSINGDMIHAYQLMLTDGQTLQLRTEYGKPLWSGSATQNGNAGDGEHTPDPQASVEEWVTIYGTMTAFQGGNMTIETSEGELIAFKTGQPRFFSEQNVYLQIGEEISVLGYYQDGQFMAGEITQVSTGARLMLRDPNGRPLWAGPGNSNGSGGNGSGGNGNGRGRGKSGRA